MTDSALTGEQIGRKFEAAWQVFSTTCAQFLAQEASYQAWFAHYVISQFGIDRVAREAIVHIRHLPRGAWRDLLGVSEARLDIVVSQIPGVRAIHYANRHYKAADGTGLSALSDLAVISELKVAFTQTEGLGHSEVVQDAAEAGFPTSGTSACQPTRPAATGVPVRSRQPSEAGVPIRRAAATHGRHEHSGHGAAFACHGRPAPSAGLGR